MRIGFAGSHGTGKTSLVKAMLKDPQFQNFKMIESTARSAKKAGYKINREADELSQLITLVSRVVEEDKIVLAGGSVISDRTPVDSLAYTAYQYNKVWDNGNPYYWKLCKEFTFNAIQRYDVVIYFPVYWEPVADDDRDPDPEYQEFVDSMIQVLLEESGIVYEHMIEGSVEERLNYVKRILT